MENNRKQSYETPLTGVIELTVTESVLTVSTNTETYTKSNHNYGDSDFE